MADDNDPNAIPTLILDRYRVERMLGEGGLGIVYLASDTRLPRHVAIKMIKRGDTTDLDLFRALDERFAREADASTRTGSHPNLVTVYDFVTTGDGTRYLIQEFVPGGTLADRIAEDSLPLADALRLTADIARGLNAAHGHGIVHRDIKPGNIFIAEDGRAQVGDFGIAQLDTLSGRTRATVGHPGTPLYMSPEQAGSTGYIRAESDQYSVGLVLFEMLTGQAFKKLRKRDALDQLARLSPPVRAMIERLIAEDPDDRYDSMGEVMIAAQAIERALDTLDADSAPETVRQEQMPIPAPTPPFPTPNQYPPPAVPAESLTRRETPRVSLQPTPPVAAPPPAAPPSYPGPYASPPNAGSPYGGSPPPVYSAPPARPARWYIWGTVVVIAAILATSGAIVAIRSKGGPVATPVRSTETPRPAATGAAVTPNGGAVTTNSATAAPPTNTPAAAASSGAGTTNALRGVAPTKRGGGGTLHLLYWQAPTTLNVHVAQGTKDSEAGAIVQETLATISINSATPDIPILAKEIPSAANGEVAADGTSVTWKLLPGVKWSDGTPFTSEDVKATWLFVVKPENGATTTSSYSNIANIDTSDPTTAKITFRAPTSVWYTAFVGSNGPVMQKKQIDACTSIKDCDLVKAPIGTGAYKVKSFTAGDNVQYVINDNYRDANAPYFDTIDLKGGGDAASAAKAVQTGQADYAWNLQVDASTFKQLTDAGKALDLTPGGGVERVLINFSDPNKDVNGEKSSPTTQHPAFSDPKVREALSWLMDREGMAKNLYGAAGNATCNVLPALPPQTNSKNTKCGYDVAKANQLLDQAGWVKGSDGIRAKNGVKMQFTFSTSVNSVRDKEAQIIKQSFQQAGIQIDIKSVDAGVFFGQPDNPDAASRFEKDLEMFTQSVGSPDSEAYFLNNFTTGQITQKSNGWKGSNYSRYSDPKYDALVDQLKKELNPDKRAQLEIQCNDYLINNFVTLPLIDRNSVNGRRTDLINTNPTSWDWNTWNIAYWQIKK